MSVFRWMGVIIEMSFPFIYRDKLVKPITVKAEGFLKERTWNKYICADGNIIGPEYLECDTDRKIAHPYWTVCSCRYLGYRS